MAKVNITIPVDEDIAALYNNASEQDKLKIAVLFNLRMRDFVRAGSLSMPELREMLDDIGAEAAATGLTPEILAEILAEDE